MLQNIPTPMPTVPPLPSQALSEETDKLLKKWLKIQIFNFYWSMVFRLIMFLLIVGSLVTSVYTLGPIVQQQLRVLQNLQQSMQGISNFTAPLQQFNEQSAPINQDQIKKLLEDEKKR